ncbi:MAG: LysM peptidoglycan-binding domain-containing protein [Muricomes sp.]|nr:LysM peptidoglycan-binding domain-containing protein [Muricomes sp.]
MQRERNYAKAQTIKKNERHIRSMLVLFIATVFIVFAACALFGNILISAHEKRSEEPVNFKYYKSIEIQPGDTLWDIAEEYITEDYRSVSEYVMVLKEMNSLSTDDIQAGQNLMIAYNDTEFINK